MLPVADVDSLAERSGFAGVVSVDRDGEVLFVKAYGLADRASSTPNAVDTRFAIASGVKGLTALTVISLTEQDMLRLSTTPGRCLAETSRSLPNTSLSSIFWPIGPASVLPRRGG